MANTVWFLSFVDPSLPEGDRFLGGILVRALSFPEAMTVTHVLGINPGGEVRGMKSPPGAVVAAKWIDRLLTRAECEEWDEEQLEQMNANRPGNGN